MQLTKELVGKTITRTGQATLHNNCGGTYGDNSFIGDSLKVIAYTYSTITLQGGIIDRKFKLDLFKGWNDEKWDIVPSEAEAKIEKLEKRIHIYQVAISAIRHGLHMEGRGACGHCNQKEKTDDASYCPGCELPADEFDVIQIMEDELKKLED